MTRSARDAVRAAIDMLEPVSESPELDADLLMAHALGMSRSDWLLQDRAFPEPPGFAPLLDRRLAHEPVAYILGHQPFWSIDLKVAPGVLIPRADSEVLIEAALRHFAGSAPAHILDLGSGPGTLLLAALTEWPEAQGTGMERSEAARVIAEDNAEALDLTERARFVAGDWTQSGWSAGLGGRFDLILCNPPYVESNAALDPQVRDHEPHEALFAGPDGLDDYRYIVPALPGLLTPRGVAILEIGWKQAESVGAIARNCRFTVDLAQDLAGRDRALILKSSA